MRAKNARLNLRHLGAIARELLPDFYGRTSSALHHGLATDRLLARWELAEPARARGSRRARRVASSQRTARRASTRCASQGGLPLSSEPRLDLDAPAAAARDPRRLGRGVPRRRRPRARVADVVRRAFESAFARGYAAVDVTTPPGGTGVAYVLERVTPPPVAAGSCGSDDHSLHEPA